jgi:ankyrin repeat protein
MVRNQLFSIFIIFSDRGSTALYVSVQNGYSEIVAELLNQHANPHVVFFNNQKKRRPIDIARENGYKEIEKVLKDYMDEKVYEKAMKGRAKASHS